MRPHYSKLRHVAILVNVLAGNDSSLQYNTLRYLIAIEQELIVPGTTSRDPLGLSEHHDFAPWHLLYVRQLLNSFSL